MNRKAGKYHRTQRHKEQQRKGEVFIMDNLQQLSQDLTESQAMAKTQSAYNRALRKDLEAQHEIVAMYKTLYKKWKRRACYLSAAVLIAVGAWLITVFAFVV